MAWDYGTFADELAPEALPVEWVWERLRLERDRRLAACDFRVLPDVPWDATPWLAYRQALRDLPDSTEDPREAVWPEPPQ